MTLQMKKLPKGFRSLDLNKMFNGKLSVKALEDYLMSIFNSRPEKDIKFMQYCKTQGFVTRSSNNLMLCDDPTCGSCSAMNNILKEEASKWRI